MTVNNKYLSRLRDTGLQYKLLLIETDGGNKRVLSKTILSRRMFDSLKIAYYSDKLKRVYLQSTKNDRVNELTTIRFDEFSLKDGVVSGTGQATSTMHIENRQICK